MSGMSPALLTLLGLLLVAVWRWQHWKIRARRHREELAALREALHCMAYESANAVNAIRAHLGDFRQINPSPAMPEHLEQIAAGADRIARVVRIADDPVAWYRQRKREDARSRQISASQPAAPMIGDPAEH
ncbi:MAG: hypothetical protein RMI94_07220 [Bryobacterales bacterium]|nr:hypothetical protein [Bryobacteraceae bacterium]MDW8130323.1 hypothetical protein [Bryobacterales bacterium]